MVTNAVYVDVAAVDDYIDVATVKVFGVDVIVQIVAYVVTYFSYSVVAAVIFIKRLNWMVLFILMLLMLLFL